MNWSRRGLLAAISSLVGVTGTATNETETDSTGGPSGFGMGAYGEAGYGGMTAECFIATAACGTDGHADVVALRRFRDEVLLQSRPGRLGVKTYYALSPPIARWISRSRPRQAAVRRLIVAPASRLTTAVTHD